MESLTSLKDTSLNLNFSCLSEDFPKYYLGSKTVRAKLEVLNTLTSCAVFPGGVNHSTLKSHCYYKRTVFPSYQIYQNGSLVI